MDQTIENRKLLWIALSELYLDTEIRHSSLEHIARNIYDSPFSLSEAKAINKYEVFPVLKYNLMSATGAWTGFQESWLIGEIKKWITNRSLLSRMYNNIVFRWMHKSFAPQWKKIEENYDSMNNSKLNKNHNDEL